MVLERVNLPKIGSASTRDKGLPPSAPTTGASSQSADTKPSSSTPSHKGIPKKPQYGRSQSGVEKKEEVKEDDSFAIEGKKVTAVKEEKPVD